MLLLLFFATVTSKDFQKLLNNQCSTQEYKRIQQEIDCRFSYIVRKLEKQLNWNVIWFDYENEDMIEGEVIKGFKAEIENSIKIYSNR